MKIMIVEDELSLAREICLLCRKWEFDTEYIRTFDHVDEEFMRDVYKRQLEYRETRLTDRRNT